MKKNFLYIRTRAIPVIGQSIYSINNFLLSFAGINSLADKSFRTWFYFSSIYFFTQSICRSTVLDFLVIGKCTRAQALFRVFYILVIANCTTFFFFTLEKVETAEIYLSLLTLNLIVFSDFFRYISISMNRKFLVLQDAIWLSVTILLLLQRTGVESYSLFLTKYYILGALASLIIGWLQLIIDHSKLSNLNNQSTLSKFSSDNFFYQTIMMANLAIFIINLLILTGIQNDYSTNLLLDIRKIVWITSPVTTFTLIFWVYLVSNHQLIKNQDFRFGTHFKAFFLFLCSNSIITIVFYYVFMNSSVDAEFLFCISIYLVSISIGQIVLPEVLKFRKEGSITGTWISSVFGPACLISILAFLGSDISVIEYCLVTLGSNLLGLIAILFWRIKSSNGQLFKSGV